MKLTGAQGPRGQGVKEEQISFPIYSGSSAINNNSGYR